MADASATVQDSHAIVYVDDRPCLDLTAKEFIHPVLTMDERWKIYVHLSAYEPYEIKRFYSDISFMRKQRTASESLLEPRSVEGVYDFVDKHFLGLTGVELEDGSAPTREKALEWLNENPLMKTRIFRECIDRVGPRQVQDDDGGRPILVVGRVSHRVPTEAILYHPVRCKEETIKMVHTLERLTETDRYNYDKAISIIENARRRELYTDTNWDVIEIMYNRKVKSLEGACLDRTPCTESNKEMWMKLVPFTVKIYVMAQAVGGIELKNV